MNPASSESLLSSSTIASQAERLVEEIRSYSTVAVAFSGGVDSAVVATAAHRALADRAVAVTGIGVAVPESDRAAARQVATLIGIRHIELTTTEIEDPNYVRNDHMRCYHCKSTLYRTLRRWADENQFATLMSGTNQDDLGDYRPGLQAGEQYAVVTPLVSLGFGKPQVRALASFFQLPIADKPASPCLASRIAYGQSVTPDRLRTIEAAELFLKNLGFRDIRVRLHPDQLVRLELELSDLERACQPQIRTEITNQMQKLGFKFVTLDLQGRQSGSLNKILPIISS